MNATRSSRCRFGLLAICVAIAAWPAHSQTSEPTRSEILATMKQAATFMSEEVAVNGGYVWVVSEDLDQRWGEVRARPSQVWLQGGTERVGEIMLDAYEATGDEYYLDVARDAADAIVFGQHPTGGWHYFIDFDPAGIPDWYETVASKFLFGMEEYRYFYGNATFDDRATQDAASFLLRFYALTLEAAYREPVREALGFVLESQYPNGAWPQRYPLRDDYAHDGFPDYTSFYTLNDGAAQANIELLIDAWEALGDARYYDAAALGAEALIALQGPDDQGCWAEQYGPDNQPIAARTHEPAGYVVRESIGAMFILGRFYLMTGDARYLEPVPRCLAWFERINRESAEQQYPKPRYWEPGTNRPIYVVPTNERTPEGYGVFLWTSDPSKTLCNGAACEWDGQPIVDVAYLRARFEETVAKVTPRDRAEFHDRIRDRGRPPPPANEDVAAIIAALDSRGAWVTDDNVVNRDNAATAAEARQPVRGISTNTFVRRMTALIAALQTDEERSQ